jgi:hypothetical protein
MAQLVEREVLQDPSSRMARERAMKTMAKAIVRKLKEDGYEPRDVVALSTELLGLLASDIKLEK